MQEDLSTNPLTAPVSIDELARLAKRSRDVLVALKSSVLSPDSEKTPPLLTGERVANICGVTKGQMAYRIKNNAAPAGTVSVRGGRREFTVEEAQAWARIERKDKLRPKGARGVVISVAFFKGGVTKTTTSMVLSQALSLMGHKVLNIDLDPQGSLSTLHGMNVNTISEAQTMAPLFYGQEETVQYAIQKTYWPEIDLIPSSSSIFSSEIALTNRQLDDSSFQFWDVLNKGLDSVRDEYDVIIIDTPPSLSNITLNAFYAADGMLIPMVPSMLDISSSAQFWNLLHSYTELIASLRKSQGDEGAPKTFDFANILLAKVNNQDSTTATARQWIQAVYGAKVLPTEVPLTTVAANKVNEFATALDVTRYEGDNRTYKRALDAYDALALHMETAMMTVWHRQIEANRG